MQIKWWRVGCTAAAGCKKVQSEGLLKDKLVCHQRGMLKPPVVSDAEPIGVEIVDSSQTIIVHWSDDHHSRYPFWYLRGYCPCAVCQGHGGGWDFVDTAAPQLEDVAEVGRYALNFVWKDRHRTGIYAFEMLRRLCPCAVCRKAQGAEHPFDRVPKQHQRT